MSAFAVGLAVVICARSERRDRYGHTLASPWAGPGRAGCEKMCMGTLLLCSFRFAARVGGAGRGGLVEDARGVVVGERHHAGTSGDPAC